jgi:hypothetical protein
MLFKSVAVLCTSVLFIGCGGTSESNSDEKILNDETKPLKDETETLRDSFPATGLIDLKNYIPQTDKEVTFLVSDSNANVNGEVLYTSFDGMITAESTRNGLDLDDYIEFDKFINLDTSYRETQSSIEFGSNYLMYTIDQEETSIPRFFDNNDTVGMKLDYEYAADFSASTGSTTIDYTAAYESDFSLCSMLYVGDYNISGIQYSDAIELSCIANRSKGGLVNGTPTIAYDYNYTSSAILLPSMGIVSVDYKSKDANYTIKWQP